MKEDAVGYKNGQALTVALKELMFGLPEIRCEKGCNELAYSELLQTEYIARIKGIIERISQSKVSLATVDDQTLADFLAFTIRFTILPI